MIPVDPLLSVGIPLGMPLSLAWDRPLYVRYLLGSDDEPELLADWAWRVELDEPVHIAEAGDFGLFLEIQLDPSDPGDVTVIRIPLRAVPIDRSGSVIVDDHRFLSGHPSDFLTDLYDGSVLGAALAGLGEIERDNVPGDVILPSGEVRLEQLANREVVLWHLANDLAFEARLQMSESAVRRFLHSGGRLFLVAGRVASRLTGLYGYPKEAPDDAAPEWTGHRIWRELGIGGRLVSIPSDSSPATLEASGLIGAEPIRPELPPLALAPSKWDPYEVLGGRYLGGINLWEGLWEPEGSSATIEPLYAAATFDTTYRFGPRVSGLDGAVIAWRATVAPEEGTSFREGRVVVFDFETYYFDDDAVGAAAAAAIDWLVAP